MDGNHQKMANNRERALLFTPGPLTTSVAVKQAMLHDFGSRDARFVAMVREIRDRLLHLAGVREETHTAVLLQGSGTFAVEAALGTLVPRAGKLLVCSNGAYGERIAKIASLLGIPTIVLHFAETQAVDPLAVHETLAADPQIQWVACVHSETTTGLLNPLEILAGTVKAHGRRLLVDAMSSFGGVPLDIGQLGMDALVSSSNKCIEGVPGFAFAIVQRDVLQASKGQSPSLVLDLHAQAAELDRSGQFRFTPPTHVLAAFRQALVELEVEGGIPARHARYRANQQIIQQGVERLGLTTLLPADLQGPIITSVHYPQDPHFDFAQLYEALVHRGFFLYPGKLSQIECFRIGNIGQLHAADIHALLVELEKVLRSQGVILPQTEGQS